MKWTYRKSRLKRWIERSRRDNSSVCAQTQVILPLWPKKTGSYRGASVYWLSPVRRIRKHSSWKPTWCLDPGFSSWWRYSDSRPGDWGAWLRTRPRHHFAGLLYLLVYWGWYPALWIGFIWLIANIIR